MGCASSRKEESDVVASSQVGVSMDGKAANAQQQQPKTDPVRAAPAPQEPEPARKPMVNPAMAELQRKMAARGPAADAGGAVTSTNTRSAPSSGTDALLTRAKGAKGRRPPSVKSASSGIGAQ